MRFNDFLLNEGIEDKGIFKAVFLAGNPGSGKTYSFSKINLGEFDPRIVNTDKLWEYYIFVKGVSQEEGEEKERVRKKVKLITKNQFYLYVNGMLPIVADTTSAKLERTKLRKKILETLGYDTAMVFVSTPLETALKRARERKRKVLEDVIIEYYERLQEIKSHYKTMFPLFLEIKNDDNELTNEVITMATKKMFNFYKAPVKNKIGKENIKKLREENKKYLVPTIYSKSEITGLLSKWY